MEFKIKKENLFFKIYLTPQRKFFQLSWKIPLLSEVKEWWKNKKNENTG